MKKGFFVIALALGAFLTSCETAKPAEEVETTENSTKVEATTVTTPSVDSAKVEEKKPEGK